MRLQVIGKTSAFGALIRWLMRHTSLQNKVDYRFSHGYLVIYFNPYEDLVVDRIILINTLPAPTFRQFSAFLISIESNMQKKQVHTSKDGFY